MSREALKQALEALEGSISLTMAKIAQRHEAVTAIEAALAQPEQEYDNGFSNGWNKCEERQAVQPVQPEQEPVAWVCYGALYKHDIDFDEDMVNAVPVGSLLYTSPPQRQPLTDAEIAEVAERMEATDAASSFWREFARAIEAKLKEKNT